MENAAEMGRRFNEGLKEIQKSSDIIGDVRGLGLWNSAEFVVDKKSKEPFDLDGVRGIAKKARAKGLICNPMVNSIEFAPPLIIDEKGIDEGLEIVANVVAANSKS